MSKNTLTRDYQDELETCTGIAVDYISDEPEVALIFVTLAGRAALALEYEGFRLAEEAVVE